MSTLRTAASIAVALAAALAGAPAFAQSASSSMSSYSSGYGATASQLSQPIDVSRRDANGNHVIVDGVTQTGEDQSVFYARRTSGAGDSYAGAGSVGGAAIGNNLQVSVVGSYNTVIVNSTQTNNAPVTAKTVLNGQVDLDAADAH